MNRILFSFFSLSFLILGKATPAWSWGDIGHGAVAEIAERNLSTLGKSFVFKLMGPEPLAVSSVFPDQVRSDERFKKFSPYHFFEISYPATVGNIPPDLRAEADADTIISQVPDRLLDPALSRDQRMVLFRYLVHVVGDVHQPLHVGNGVDMGANLCDVKWTNPESNQVRTVNLHTAWDENLIQNIAYEEAAKKGPSKAKRWFGYKEMADLVIAEGGVDGAKVGSLPLSEWYRESRDLHAAVYPDVKEILDPNERTYCKVQDRKTKKVVNGKYNPDSIPSLSDDYIKRSTSLIKRQILKGGYRLATIINKIAAEQGDDGSAGKTPELEKTLLDEILLKNSGPGRDPQGAKKAAKKDREKSN